MDVCSDMFSPAGGATSFNCKLTGLLLGAGLIRQETADRHIQPSPANHSRVFKPEEADRNTRLVNPVTVTAAADDQSIH